MSPHDVSVDGVSPAEKAARLRYTGLFRSLDPAELRALAERCEVRDVEPDELIVEQGESGEHLFVVTTGILRATRHDDAGVEYTLGNIQKGECFGELALLGDGKRMASVRAVSGAQLLSLSQTAFEAFVENHPEVEEGVREAIERRSRGASRVYRPSDARLLAHLERVLPGVSRSALQALREELEGVSLPADTVIMRQGERGDCMYFVVDGALRVTTERGENFVNEIRGGETVGEMALLTHEVRSADVRSEIATTLLRLSRDGFEALVAESPGTLDAFQAIVVERIRRQRERDATAARRRTVSPLTLDECDDIMRTRDLVLRNLKITLSYHRLAIDLTSMLGNLDVNWPGFGAHASKTAGYAIRKEELPLHEIYAVVAAMPVVGKRASSVVDRLATSALARPIDEMMQSVSRAMSEGNLRIFNEMAPTMVRFLEIFRDDEAFDAEKLALFLATLKPGPSEEEGQDLLGASFAAWYEAAHEADPKRRSELILLGNARMGLHEQTRVQPDIEEGLSAPFRMRLGDDIARALFGERSLVPGVMRGPLRRQSERIERRIIHILAKRLREIITRRMMRLRLPYGDVRLGRDVVSGPGAGDYPPELMEIENPQLQALVDEWCRAPSSLDDTRAVDWARLDERMNFIVGLFRSRQKNLELFRPPFELEQIHSIGHDRVPAGRL
jgi:CRP-like cAMP-binding protein